MFALKNVDFTFFNFNGQNLFVAINIFIPIKKCVYYTKAHHGTNQKALRLSLRMALQFLKRIPQNVPKNYSFVSLLKPATSKQLFFEIRPTGFGVKGVA